MVITGSGTENDPHTITDYEQLLCIGRAGAIAIASGVDCGLYTDLDSLNKHYKLSSTNIDASMSCPGYDGTNGATVACGDGQKAWAPLRFSGSFDGAGFTVSKLYYKINASDTQYGGLFGYADGATIKNVGLVDGYIDVTSSGSHAGGLGGVDGEW